MLAFDLTANAGVAETIFDAGDLVIVTAALSSPDVCMHEPARARAVNVDGAIRTIGAALTRGARVVFLSSDTVYGETQSPVDESTPPNPAGAYAGMKHEVEKRFADEAGVKMVRLSYVFSAHDRFTSHLIRCAETGEVVQIFHPFMRAVVHLEDVVDAILGIGSRWNSFAARIINLGGPQLLSLIDYAEILRDVALPNLRFSVTEPAEAFFTGRPRAIDMRSPIFEGILGRPARTLKDAAILEFKGKHQAL